MQGPATDSRMPSELVFERGHTTAVFPHKLTATVSKQQGSFQPEYSQAAMLRLSGVLGSSQYQSEQSNCQQPAWDYGSSCQASQQVTIAM